MLRESDKDVHAWYELKSDRKNTWIEWCFRQFVAIIASSVTFLVFLIFLFVFKEAWPAFWGSLQSDPVTVIYQPEQLTTLSPSQIQSYLELTPEQYASMDQATLRTMMEVKMESLTRQATHKDSAINSTSWRYLLLPYQWEGYEKDAYVWQPVSDIPKYNIIPLLIGSLKTTLVALLFAVPVALGAAIYVSQLCPAHMREWIKPAIEFLAGIPSVVLGFFALMVMASFMNRWFGFETRLNAFVAGIALGLAVIPIVFSITEDALSSVPRHFSESALALGATRWQAAWSIVIPVALPAILAAIILGFGRAIGEAMIVLMASGNAGILSMNLGDSARTITATIAAELAETVFGNPHYRILFMLGTILFGITFVANWTGNFIIRRLKLRLEVPS